MTVRLGRAARVAGGIWLLAIAATCTAPDASAATNAAVLNWTGLHDDFGVPIGDYYLAMPSVREQMAIGSPAVGWNPDSWAAWTMHALAVLADRFATAGILTAEAGLFIGLIALALWVMKLTISTYWLIVVGEIARAISTAVVDVTTQLGLLTVAIPLGVFLGAVTVRRGEVGRGWTMILVALTLPALSVTLFADPADRMYGPDGILAFGRNVGFSVAKTATLDTGGGADVTTLTASLITHIVREPLQLWNFGHVVDGVGGCGAAWSAAVRAGATDGPITAMRICGDRAAVAHAMLLDGTNIWVGAVLTLSSVLLSWFMVASGWAVLKVSVKAVWTTVVLLPALWLGAIPGAAQRRATEVVWQFFKHGIEVCVHVVYVSVIGLAVQRMVSTPLPAELGGTSPFAHVLVMAGVSVAALALLRHVKAELTGRPPGRGALGRGLDVAAGMGLRAAVGSASGGVAGAARGVLSRRGGESSGPAPWEIADGDASSVHGAPRPGFEPVSGGAGLATEASPPTAGFDGGSAETGQRQSNRSARPAAPGTAPPGSASPGREPSSEASERTATDPPSVPPMAETQAPDYLPLPPEPPDDEPPPDDRPDDDGPDDDPPASVDPITDA